MELYEGDNFKPVRGAIYTLDIETSSIFELPDGSYSAFDYTKRPAYYEGRQKIALPYIWVFGVNDTVYYGRDFRQLSDVFQRIRRTDRKEIIWIHNLSFETQFMFDLFEGMNITNLLASSLRHPIAYTVEELTQYLQEAGFRDIKVYGERRHTAPREGEQRIFFVARKEASE